MVRPLREARASTSVLDLRLIEEDLVVFDKPLRLVQDGAADLPLRVEEPFALGREAPFE